MSRIWGWIKSFASFWYGFVIGDDWVAAAGVVVMLGGAGGLRALGVAAWWFGPLAILGTVTYTVHRALCRDSRRTPTSS